MLTVGSNVCKALKAGPGIYVHNKRWLLLQQIYQKEYYTTIKMILPLMTKYSQKEKPVTIKTQFLFYVYIH